MNYEELVQFRKDYNVDILGLVNTSSIPNNLFDQECFLEPLAKWHNSIPADIMVIGQDWGSLEYYLDNNGRDNVDNPTCRNLISLFHEIGIEIGTPINPISNSLHFTNIIPFIRIGKMSGDLNLILNQNQINEFAETFIKPLVEIVNPKIIITLGLSSYKGLMSIFDKSYRNDITLKKIINDAPITLRNNLILFPMYHCGASTVNRNRNLHEQKQDWLKIKPYLKSLNATDMELTTISRNEEAKRNLKEISALAVSLQEIYALEATYNQLRLSENGDKYFEQWRSIRAEGYQLGEQLKNLAEKF